MQTKRRVFMGGLLAAMVGWPMARAQQARADVGLSMPTLALQRWVVDGLALVRSLDKLGYSSELQFANNEVPAQIAQIDGMLQKGVKLLIVAPIDGSTLGPILKKAAEQKVKVISYDRLIRNTPHIDYYATFDNYQVGVLQGTEIARRLKLDESKVPLTIELFGGSPDDNNAFFFYDGAMSILKPYLDKGQLLIGSGQAGMDSVSTKAWNGATARLRLEKLLERHYAKQRLNAILSPNDGIAIELLAALKKAGYGAGGFPLPVVSGQDADLQSVRSIIRQEQAFTIFKDTRELAQVTAGMASAILTNRKPQINDEKTYNNGEKLIQSYLLKPVVVDVGNWRESLVGSGYYKDYLFR
ncbi:sugar-binding protein [uncultured Rhodoferax sp.]|uniref:substrate-binding domain-containing protein n=1 Tax=uncultured Rhodoferax sp. TaxID=223188 RepID=UPI0025E2F687|nr:sugar-binding protein [uncultured Rhodoferax sp.]